MDPECTPVRGGWLHGRRSAHVRWPPFWRRRPLLTLCAVLLVLASIVDHLV